MKIPSIASLTGRGASCPIPTTPATEAQKKAGKPWVIGIFVAWGLPVVSIAAMAIYVFASGNFSSRFVAPLCFGSLIGSRVIEGICLTRLQSILPDMNLKLTRYWISTAVCTALLGTLLASSVFQLG